MKIQLVKESLDNNIIDFLMSLLNKRVKYLHNYAERQKKLGYRVDEYNIRIEGTQILFDAFFGKDIEDCGFKIEEDSVLFLVSGTEGMDKVKFNINENPDTILKLIKKHARDVDSGGLK